MGNKVIEALFLVAAGIGGIYSIYAAVFELGATRAMFIIAAVACVMSLRTSLAALR